MLGENGNNIEMHAFILSAPVHLETFPLGGLYVYYRNYLWPSAVRIIGHIGLVVKV